MKNKSTPLLSLVTLALSTLLFGSCSTFPGAPSSSKQASHAPSTFSSDLIRSDFAPGELIQLCQTALGQAETKMDTIAKIKTSDRTFDNTVLAFENANADESDVTQSLSFMKYVSTDKNIHAEGAKCEQISGDFGVKTLGRRDLYDAMKEQHPRNSDEARLLQKTLESFEANGLKLPDDKLAQVTNLMTKLNDLQTEFSENLNKDDSHIELTREELNGVSDDFLSRLHKTPDGNRYIVTTKITDYEQVMENAKNPETRRKVALVYNNRQGLPNTKLLEEAIQVREKIAALMGFPTWADYQLSHGRMAKDSKTVMAFLDGLKGKLAQRNRKDLAQLLAFKKTIQPGADHKATHLDPWDLTYLSYQLQKRDYKIDEDKIREYFPSDFVVQSMFEVYSELLGVHFQQVIGAHTWSNDVKLYKILDNKDDRLIGYFYTDFIPRQDKYEHFAAFTLLSARKIPGDGYNKPISAIVGNFNPPANGKPSLLNHEEVITIFHEFGHVMHQTLTRAPYERLSGSSVDQDFVEAPSQMLENWPWEAKILDRLSGHYLNSKKKLPHQMLKKMLALREFQQGYSYSRQLMLALTDMIYHTTQGPVDTAAVYNQQYRSVLGIEPIEGGHFAAGFGHLMGGYDAGYYGYLWSEVYAEDMFSIFKKEGVLNAKTGDRYRRDILERGNMEDADILLTHFLGRPSNNKAFLKKLHIE